MTYTFRRKLMYTNKSPRRIDRKAGARNKKIIKPLYSSPCYLGEIEKQKKKKWKNLLLNLKEVSKLFMKLMFWLWVQILVDLYSGTISSLYFMMSSFNVVPSAPDMSSNIFLSIWFSISLTYLGAVPFSIND